MTRLAVTLRLKPDASGRAAALIAKGPPFDPAALGLERHGVYLSHGEVVFLFEGPQVEWIVDELVSRDPDALVFQEWQDLIDGIPRLAQETYFWQREEPPSGASPDG
jgi:hypothetical protein